MILGSSLMAKALQQKKKRETISKRLKTNKTTTASWDSQLQFIRGPLKDKLQITNCNFKVIYGTPYLINTTVFISRLGNNKALPQSHFRRLREEEVPGSFNAEPISPKHVVMTPGSQHLGMSPICTFFSVQKGFLMSRADLKVNASLTSPQPTTEGVLHSGLFSPFPRSKELIKFWQSQLGRNLQTYRAHGESD